VTKEIKHIEELQQAVVIIKEAIQRSQASALQHVNNEVLFVNRRVTNLVGMIFYASRLRTMSLFYGK
jgi:hypothetical protein